MSDDIKYWHLRNHKLFWVLNNSQIRQLCILANFKKAKKGEIFQFSDPENPRIYFLKKGNIKIVEVDESGNELIVDIIQKGEIFGELDNGLGKPGNEYAQALTDQVVLCSFFVADFERLLVAYPNLALTYTKFVGFQLKRIKNNYSNLFFKSAKQRLISFLKDWVDREGTQTEGRVYLKNYLTHQEISQIICTSRQTATQILNQWESEGILVYSRKEIIINDLNRLN
ncbi:Crp/Fnr family transcriptional regulator [Mariniradius sediminis]|uniref:Crp/Fnr family transcriptional regulator n=1 Tax=Mariniradius sediminis TaxID=2909237 RepID=A0ABS9BPL3_9BACT|nr:Crp/Fnr family transcriptional regulator [Mariniradius sediminis]MCF1749995.1 Crp/Fnr family transcriptional regulator [Mariniradius sediminis]